MAVEANISPVSDSANAEELRSVVYPLTHDPGERVVCVGERVFRHPRLGRRPEINLSIKEEVCGLYDGRGDLEKIHAHFCRLLGPRFNYRFHAAQYHTWVGPHFTQETANLLKGYGFRGWRHYSNEKIELAHAAIEHVQQAERDDLTNLIPAIMAYGASPEQIKQTVGKGAWKRIARTSKSRASLILAKAIETGTTFEEWLGVPTGVMPYVNVKDALSLMAARITPRLTIRYYMATFHMVRDTARMCDDFNTSWSYSRVEREHALGMRRKAKRQYSAKKFADSVGFQKGAWSADLLTSPAEIAEEGGKQHHCVSIYSGRAANGEYAVFSIDGPERLTLGLSKSLAGWSVDQLYCSCNAPAGVEAHEFARWVCDQFSAPEQRAVA